MISTLEIVDSIYSSLLKRDKDIAANEFVNLLDNKQLSLQEFLKFIMSLDEVYARASPDNLSNAISLLYAKGSSHIGNAFTWNENPYSLVFYHFAKTGGTSLSNLLCKNFHPLQLNNPKYRKYIARHFRSWDEYELLPAQKMTITCLRNPSSRLKSLISFLSSISDTVHPEYLETATLANKGDWMNLLDSKNPKVINQINNVYVRSLSGFIANCDSDPLIQNYELALEIATKRILDFEMVYFLEELRDNSGFLPDRILVTLEKFFHNNLNGKLEIFNKTNRKSNYQNPPNDLIEKNIWIDNIFYNKISSELGLLIKSF